MPSRKRKSKKPAERPSARKNKDRAKKDLVKICPYTDEKVWITTVTCKDIEKVRKTGTCPSNSRKKQLLRIPSQKHREELYQNAARALEQKELECLPLYGGRPWSVVVRVTESSGNGSKPPLFRWFRGELELATLPHFLERIPEPPRLKGIPEYAEVEEEVATALQEREVSTLSTMAWNLQYEGCSLPTINIKWISPCHQIFNSRKAAWQHMEQLAENEVLLDRHLLGIGANGTLLKPVYPSVPKKLAVGKMRFERDGLWIVGQCDSWQEERQEHQEELRKKIGSKCKEVEGSLTPSKRAPTEDDDGSNSTTAAPTTKRRMSALAFYLQSERHRYRDQAFAEDASATMTLRDAETELRAVWKTLSRETQEEWKIRAMQHQPEQDEAAVPVEDDTADNALTTKRRMSALAFYLQSERRRYRDQVLSEDPSATMTLRQAETELRSVWKTLPQETQKEWKVRALQYQREQDEEAVPAVASMPQETHASSDVPAVESCPKNETKSVDQTEVDLTAMETSKVHESIPAAASLPQETHASSVAPLVKSGPKNDTTSAGPVNVDPAMVKTDIAKKVLPDQPMLEEERKQKVSHPELEASTTLPANVDSSDSNVAQQADHDLEKNEPALTNQSDEIMSAVAHPVTSASNPMVAPVSPSPPLVSMNEKGDDVALSALYCDETMLDGNTQNEPSGTNVANGVSAVVAARSEHASASEEPEKPAASNESKVTASNKPPTANSVKRKKKSSSRRTAPSTQWRLSKEHIDMCHSAATEHFETVMNTVKARALHSELQDGFDLLRERGRGRYDMELPVFDTDAFSFLTDLSQTSWLPIVKEALGPDVCLIHKGVFLSMPGAERQDYHQDGLHLTTKTQRPCHAVNVFIPLVDLGLRNGPTEFCLGSHILGHEDFDRDRLETPTVPAGTPVMFDYRLGHRGLANSSSSCRPIVYCTYAASANGKEFRDEVNFSRRRYHKIGELVGKPLSRDERAKRRKLAVEEEEEVEVMEVEKSDNVLAAEEEAEEVVMEVQKDENILTNE